MEHTTTARAFIVRRADGQVVDGYDTEADAAAAARRLNAAAQRNHNGQVYLAVPNPDLSTDPARVEHWIQRIVTAGTEADLLTIGVQACAAGHATTRLRCVVCFPVTSPPMTITGLVAHVRQALADEQLRHHYTDIRLAPTLTRFPARSVRR